MNNTTTLTAQKLQLTLSCVFEDGTYQQQTMTPKRFKRPESRHWLDITGPASLQTLQKVLQDYALHPLLLEDLSIKNQRAKIEDYEQYVFIVLRGGMFVNQQLKNQVLYLIVGKDFLISYQPKTLLMQPWFEQRLTHQPYWHKQDTFDYLLYLFLDSWVDTLMNSVDAFSSKVEKLEGALIEQIDHPDNEMLPRIQRMKHDASRLRRSAMPLREVLSALMRNGYPVLSDQYAFYLRDTYDHSLQFIENLDFSRETLTSLIEMTLNAQSNHMNQQMRLLTSVSMIFMPLTLIAGIYGMNFDYMPELHWRYSYFVVLGLMAFITLACLVVLTRRKWL